MKTRMNTLAQLFAATLFALTTASSVIADEAYKLWTLVAPRDAEQRNPTTEIHVKFGDVAHLSPWRVKRRHPRTGGPRGGQLVSLHDALLAISELVAMDEEMPAHTFEFNEDGSIKAICDIPFGKQPASIGVRFDGQEIITSLSAEELARPVRDFFKVEFIKCGVMPADTATSTHSAGARPVVAAVSSHRQGESKTITLPGGAKLELIWCASGSFVMGSPKTEIGRFDDEPQHDVTLTKGFWLGKYEITQAQWKSVMGTNPSRFKGDNRPVETVSWDDCQQFLRKVNVALKGAARLPTEAEWEYACRAGTTGAVSGTGHITTMAWYDGNSGNQSHEVGRHGANDWGFYDMHGNVLEWCADWFSNSDETPAHVIDPKGPPSGSFRILRGGCWFYYERDCRSAYRLKRDPSIRNAIFGMRLACSDALD